MSRIFRTSTMGNEKLVGSLDMDAKLITVPKGWSAQTGALLLPDVMIGKLLGEGFQGKVFELTDLDGRVAAVVLKAAKAAALISNIQREWAVGQKVTSLQDEKGYLPGFMKVGPGLVNTDGKMVGQVLERLNGVSCSKVLKDRKFADARYLRQMLLEVFTALDKAQRKFGFHHYDLRCDNVFEHTPSREQNSRDELSVLVSGQPEHRVYDRQFKVIDYGLTKLDDHYSWASGWVETQLAEQRLRTSGSLSSAGLERASVVDDEVVAAATDPTASQRLAARQARKLQKKWTKPSGFEWCDEAGPPLTLLLLNLQAECVTSPCSSPSFSLIHKQAWASKGDVYHLLFDICWFIYGNTWPREDSILVYLLFALIQHTTAIQPAAWFTAPTEATSEQEDLVAEAANGSSVGGGTIVLDADGLPHRREINDKSRSGCSGCWQLYLRYSRIRRWGLKLKAFYLPSNSGLRAAEALRAAFFLHGLEDI